VIAECKYICIGKEVGESGTPHLQIALVWPNAKTFSACLKLLPQGVHLEIARNIFESIAYCKKDGNFQEKGVPPMNKEEQGKQEQDRWSNILELTKKGRFEDLPSKIQFNQARLLEYIRAKALLDRDLVDTEMQMLWFWGPPGTGKSRKARADYPKAYLKMCNKWWDDYKDEPEVLIEDFDKSHSVLCHHLKIWADRYPFLCECKGGAFKIRPQLIVVTSNWHPSEIWLDDKDLGPILRRFKCVEFGQNPFNLMDKTVKFVPNVEPTNKVKDGTPQNPIVVADEDDDEENTPFPWVVNATQEEA